MELMRGGELFDAIAARKRLTEGEARMVFAQLASGVAHLHSLGVAHRDLKPQNLMYVERCSVSGAFKAGDLGGQIKIMDYDLARVNYAPQWEAATPCGTTDYMVGARASSSFIASFQVSFLAALLLCYLLCFYSIVYRRLNFVDVERPHQQRQQVEKFLTNCHTPPHCSKLTTPLPPTPHPTPLGPGDSSSREVHPGHRHVVRGGHTLHPADWKSAL
jgi:serine/threonine protein kinase